MISIDWSAILNAAVTAGAVYGALRVELRWLRKDTDKNAQDIEHIHRRIDDMNLHQHKRANR